MHPILLVEDSAATAATLTARLRQELDAEVILCQTLRDVEETLRRGGVFSAAICDLHLPDAPDGEVVSRTREAEIPTIVFTSRMEDALRESIWRLGVVDYVLKQGPAQIDHVLWLVRALENNPATGVLVVDDASLARRLVTGLLRTRRYNVFEASDPAEASRILAAEPSIRLLITDYEMPGKNGVELVREVRQNSAFEQLAILGMSALNHKATVEFLKNGADDFLIKPFLAEELLVRVTRVLQSQENLRALRRAAHTDYLTGVSNRRHFLESAENLVQAQPGAHRAVMIDIDHFKKVNDTYGHEAGDKVLIEVSRRLQSIPQVEGLAARWGGEEFALLLPCAQVDACAESLRRDIQQTRVSLGGGQAIQVTISVGVSDACSADSVTKMLAQADERLYLAKQQGRNRVVSAG